MFKYLKKFDVQKEITIQVYLVELIIRILKKIRDLFCVDLTLRTKNNLQFM